MVRQNSWILGLPEGLLPAQLVYFRRFFHGFRASEVNSSLASRRATRVLAVTCNITELLLLSTRSELQEVWCEQSGK